MSIVVAERMTALLGTAMRERVGTKASEEMHAMARMTIILWKIILLE
jgi:hypothetical protein